MYYTIFFYQNELFLKYENINWKQCKLELFKLQSKILKAFRNKNTKDVLKAQHTLTRSFAARALAVQKVTTNKGKNTYGIDKIVLKANGKLRSLGIPTVKDQIVQTLYYFAIDPMSEETACKKSYGFRLHRGLDDNAIYLKLVLGLFTSTRRYVLKADILGFSRLLVIIGCWKML